MRRDAEERRAGGRGTEERGQRERTLFFLPSSERVAIDTVHLIKIRAHPPTTTPEPLSLASPPSFSLWSAGLRAAACPLGPFKLKCSPLQDRKNTQTERRLYGLDGERERPWTYATTTSYAAVFPPDPRHPTPHTHTRVENDQDERSGRPKMQTFSCYGITF